MSFIKKNCFLVVGVIIIIFAFFVTGTANYTNNKKNTISNDDIEKYKEKTNNFTFCELGDLVGEDVERLNYKEYRIDYHSSEFTPTTIEEFANKCINKGAESEYQVVCCVRYQMYPFD